LSFTAKVVRVYPKIDQAMRTRTIEARLIDPVQPPVPGMFARLTLELQKVTKAVLVPAEAVVTTQAGGHVVFVLDQGKVRRRSVQIGIRQTLIVQVLKGVKPGERVVVAGQAALRDGQPVRVSGKGKSGSSSPPSGKKKPPINSTPKEGA